MIRIYLNLVSLLFYSLQSPNYFAIAIIEPHLHRHIIGRKGQNLQRVKDTYGVEIIVPDEKDESPDILIVFEGKEGEEIPSDRKKKEAYIKDVLEKAKNELIKAGQDAVSIKNVQEFKSITFIKLYYIN